MVFLLAVVITITTVLGTQLQVSDSARAAARSLALGSESGSITAIVARVAGPAARYETTVADGWATVKVSKAVGLGPLRFGPLNVSGTATAWLEP